MSRDPIGEQGGDNLFRFICNDGIGDVDILGLRQTRFTLKEMEAMLNKSRQDFQAKLIAKCGFDDLSWIDNQGIKQCCHLSTCVEQAELLATAFYLKLRATFTSNFNKHGNVIAFDHHSVWADSINTRADKAPENGMVWRDFNKGFGLKCWGMQMLMRREFELVERPFKERKIQCFKGGDVGNHQKNTVASHHWFGIYIGTNTDKTKIDVLVDPWYSAGGIISPVSAGVSGDQAKYFDANALW